MSARNSLNLRLSRVSWALLKLLV